VTVTRGEAYHAEAEVQEVVEIFEAYGVTALESAPVVAALRQRPARWVDLMMS
jgi:hypothetical protein